MSQPTFDDTTDEFDTPYDRQEALWANQTEDVMDFIMRSGTATSSVGVAKHRAKVLELSQLWGEVLVDTKHFSRTMGSHITIGANTGWRWNFLGVDMGWVPAPLQLVLPYAPPMWSEVNSDWRNDFYLSDDHLPDTEHRLFELEDETYTAVLHKGWDGFVDVGDKRHTFDELVQAGRATQDGDFVRVPMTDELRLMVDIDGSVFFAHMVFEADKLLHRNSEQVDYPFLSIFAFMAFLGMMVMIMVWLQVGGSEVDVTTVPDRFATVQLDQLQTEPPPEEKVPAKQDTQETNPDAGAGERAKDDAGKVGKRDANLEQARGDKAAADKQQLDRQVAETAGLFANVSALDQLLGGASLDASTSDAVGALIGVKGHQIGTGGLAGRGDALGGGGRQDSMGNGFGPRGPGGGRQGFGKEGGNFGPKRKGGITKPGGPPVVIGGLAKSAIDEVIKRNMKKIRYCYQRELTKNPALAGKVVEKFTIAADGTVSRASTKTSTLGNPSTEGCINKTFMRMKFPKPKGNGIVIVSYPFLFSPG